MDEIIELLGVLVRAVGWVVLRPKFFLPTAAVAMLVLLWLWGAYPLLPSPLPAWHHRGTGSLSK